MKLAEQGKHKLMNVNLIHIHSIRSFIFSNRLIMVKAV